MTERPESARCVVKLGMVYLVGAGPGDPDLVTVKGVNALRRAEVLVYDYLANPRIMDYAPASAERVYVGKQAGAHSLPQEEINRLLIRRAEEGSTVVRLKGGDPYIFGRGGEEACALHEAGIPFEVIPGITSAIAVPAFAGIPLTDRRKASSVALITGHEDPTKPESRIRWESLAVGVDTLVFLMGARNLPLIVERLTACGRSPQTPVAVIHQGTGPQQKTVTGALETIVEQAEAEDIRPPSVIVVGEVVSLRDRLNWFERRPLFGKTIVVTRAREQASVFLERLEELGAQCVAFPTIETVPPSSWDQVDLALNSLSTYQWILFTSVNGVRYFFHRMHVLHMDARDLHGLSIGAIGPATAEALHARELRVEFVPTEYRAEGIIEQLGPRLTPGMRVLLPRAGRAREVLPERLEERGIFVHVVTAYDTVMPADRTDEIREGFTSGHIDMVTFTSSSTVTNFMAMFQPGEAVRLLQGVDVACIGPVTAETASRCGVTTHVQPADYTIVGMVDAIRRYYSSR